MTLSGTVTRCFFLLALCIGAAAYTWWQTILGPGQVAANTSLYLTGGVLGGLAGLLVLYSAGIDFTAPLGLTLSGFGAAIVFGVGSPVRCLFGGIAMGVAQALASGYFSEALSAMTPFLFILFVLSTRPADIEALAGGRP